MEPSPGTSSARALWGKRQLAGQSLGGCQDSGRDGSDRLIADSWLDWSYAARRPAGTGPELPPPVGFGWCRGSLGTRGSEHGRFVKRHRSSPGRAARWVGVSSCTPKGFGLIPVGTRTGDNLPVSLSHRCLSLRSINVPSDAALEKNKAPGQTSCLRVGVLFGGALHPVQSKARLQGQRQARGAHNGGFGGTTLAPRPLL